MAALLCQSLCNILGDCCSGITYPCSSCCNAVGKMICSPFTPYLTVTILFNVPVMLFGWNTFENNVAFACEKAWWLWCNSALAFIHIFGSCYIVYKIQEEKDPYQDGMEEEAYYQQPPQVHYPPQKAVPSGPPRTFHIVGIAGGGADDVSALDNGTTVIKRDGSGDSKEPLTSSRPPQTISPRSCTSPRSVSSKSQSPFRTIFAPCKNPDHQQQACSHNHPPNAIESVASLVAGLPDDVENDRANSLHRLGNVLCYDPGTAMYFFVAFIWVIWQSVGVVVAMQLASETDVYDELCEEIKDWVVISTVCGFLYMMLVLFAFGCSLLCLR